ncbi:MAG: N-acetylmuramoyl-L-alanine amidase, partial [Myxococcales bacterium]|nr:N-acetylmuramoyl-L-alanine amidase [Myxococcales bacterium]
MTEAVDALIVAGADVAAPAGLCVRNYRDPEVTRFAGRDRSGRQVNELILHETVTRSVDSTVKVLLKRKLGVQLIVGPDGEVTQHGDLAHDRLAHAGGHNGPSVGIEVVNPYYPKYASAKLPW